MPNELTQRLQDIPGLRQLMLLLGLAGAIALGIWLFFWTQQPGYAPLFSGLADKDAAEVTEALRGAGIPYRIEPTGAISVPQAQLHDARLKLAAQGLPQGSRVGFELMRGEQGFGVSQFVEGARYQHALETEIARTIATLRPVRDARVHLALPKPSAFTRGREPASASVVLELFPGRTLESNQVAAIVHMVATSVPEMSAERVTVIDQSGRLLTQPDPNSDAAISAQQFEQTRRLEAAFAQRVRDLLEPLTGPGRVNVQVTVDMDFTVTEEAREVYLPDAKVRSEQVSEQPAVGAAALANNANAAGIPGAASNIPPAAEGAEGEAAAAPAAPAGLPMARQATRNFELDRHVSHVRQPAGRIRRVSAAVLVDHVPEVGEDGQVELRPLSEERLARIEALVREAVGFDASRGDSVAVMNAPFVRPEPVQGVGEPPIWEHPLVGDILRLLVGGGAVLALVFGVLRPTLRQIVMPTRIQALPEPAFERIAGPTEAELVSDAVTRAANSYEERLQVARTAVAQDPRRVAQVVKSWVGADG